MNVNFVITYPHFTDKETEFGENYQLTSGHTDADFDLKN